MTLTPAIRDFLGRLEDLLDGCDWPDLDRDSMAPVPGRDTVSVVLAHRHDPALNVELQVSDRLVVVTYGPEHQHFTDPDEALAFVEMLGAGRVRLVVRRLLVWNSIRSYRDGQSLPFAKTSEPWLNLRPRVERFDFGFC